MMRAYNDADIISMVMISVMMIVMNPESPAVADAASLEQR